MKTGNSAATSAVRRTVLFIIVMLLQPAVLAQFDEIIIDFEAGTRQRSITALDDINQDGYDDFAMMECNTRQVWIFLGGSPPSSEPAYKIQFVSPNEMAALDCNDDGIKDLIVTEQNGMNGDPIPDGKISILYLGADMDTLPDLRFSVPRPPWNGNYFADNMPSIIFSGCDFNGDSHKELWLWDVEWPYFDSLYAFLQLGCFYVYNIDGVFDTIPTVKIEPDTSTGGEGNIWDASCFGNMSWADINGDGFSDIYLTSFQFPRTHALMDPYANFIHGNASWDLTPHLRFCETESRIPVYINRLIPDINGDGYDDIVLRKYKYNSPDPIWYGANICFGGPQWDTIPEARWQMQLETIQHTICPGDINGDGYNDILARMTYWSIGNVRAYVGAATLPEEWKAQWYAPDGVDLTVGGVGDFNGDGLNDFAIGSCSSYFYTCINGRVWVINGDSTVIGDGTTLGITDNTRSTEPELLTIEGGNLALSANAANSIAYTLSQPAAVSISLIDILGRELELKPQFNQGAGEHTFSFDPSAYRLSSGVYILLFRARFQNGVMHEFPAKLSIIK